MLFSSSVGKQGTCSRDTDIQFVLIAFKVLCRFCWSYISWKSALLEFGEVNKSQTTSASPLRMQYVGHLGQ